MDKIVKFPRTPHLVGSGVQAGDEDLNQVPFSKITGRNIVIEEKVDGANVGVSFSGGVLLLQSRGHYLTGGYRERHYDLFKRFCAENREILYSVLGERYILYGEWLYAKHKVYYDALPAFFVEFDIFDKERKVFLDTPTRKKMLEPTGIVSAPVLAQGVFKSQKEILSFLGKSLFKSDDCFSSLRQTCSSLSIDYDEVLLETDCSALMEGLYIKVEEDGVVTLRVKFVRPAFKQVPSLGRWIDKTIIPNKLK